MSKYLFVALRCALEEDVWVAALGAKTSFARSGRVPFEVTIPLYRLQNEQSKHTRQLLTAGKLLRAQQMTSINVSRASGRY